MPTLPLCNIVLEVPARVIIQEIKILKDIQNIKEKSHIISGFLYIEKSKDSTEENARSNKRILIKLQNTKSAYRNQWGYFTLIINHSIKKLNKNNFIYNYIKKNKMFRSKLNQRGERLIH